MLVENSCFAINIYGAPLSLGFFPRGLGDLQRTRVQQGEMEQVQTQRGDVVLDEEICGGRLFWEGAAGRHLGRVGSGTRIHRRGEPSRQHGVWSWIWPPLGLQKRGAEGWVASGDSTPWTRPPVRPGSLALTSSLSPARSFTHFPSHCPVAGPAPSSPHGH